MTVVRDNYVLDLAQARRGYALNQLLGSLMHAGNRALFGAEPGAYCDSYGLPPEQKRAVLARDYAALLEEGASVFYAFKLTMVDRQKMAHLSAPFTGMSPEEFDAVMRSGGRRLGGEHGLAEGRHGG